MENKMKKFCQLLTTLLIAVVMVTGVAFAQQTRSTVGSYSQPYPFTEIGNARADAAISTGYYFMDINDVASGKWKPGANPDGSTTGLLPLTFEPTLWKRIYPGPRSVPVNELESGYDETKGLILPPPSGKVPAEGYRYFRNPRQYALYLNSYYTDDGIDSTTNAFAGPIPIGFAFYFNGIRYDSFYVSTRGLVALSNRRYLYNGEGKRAIPPSKTDCYDPMSADWPFPTGAENPTQGRRHLAVGVASVDTTIETTQDNYGFYNIACGGNPMSLTPLGIRQYSTNGDGVGPNNQAPSQNPSMKVRLSNNVYAGGAFLAAMEGPHILNPTQGRGQVWYKRSMLSDRLIIYIKNLQLEAGTYNVQNANPNSSWTVYSNDSVPVVGGVSNPMAGNNVSGSVQIELNRLDSSVTYRYGEFEGILNPTTGNKILGYNAMQVFSSIAVGGYARHKSYNTKDAGTITRPETDPWGGQYSTYTQQWNGYPGKTFYPSHQPSSGMLSDGYQIKFKQWKNSLRLVDIQYYIRGKESTSQNFDVVVKKDQVRNNYNPFEVYAGHMQLGELQPVGIIQNLTNDIQGPTGVNFVPQDFQFQARLQIRNKITDRYIYNRSLKISEHCLYLDSGINDPLCGADPYAMVRHANVTVTSGVYTATKINDAAGAINGIPPYNFVLCKFPRFKPIESIDDEKGVMLLTVVTEPIDPNTNVVVGDDWPFDDADSVEFWVISNNSEFRSNGEFSAYEKTGQRIPSHLQWVYSRYGAQTPSIEVVGAQQNVTKYPVPPIGNFYAINTTKVNLYCPMYKFAWAATDNGIATKGISDGTMLSLGSKITSFPIDMRNKQGSLVTLAVHRGTLEIPTERGFADAMLYGPEGRVVFNGGYDATTRQTGKLDNANNTGDSKDPDFDYLAVEYLRPSADGIKKITMTGTETTENEKFNITGDNNNDIWRYHPYWKNSGIASVIQNAPALAVYGGGGYFVGFAYADTFGYQGKATYWPISWNGGTTGANDMYGGGGVAIYDKTTDQKGQNNPYSTVISPTNAQLSMIVGGLIFNPYDVGFDNEFYRYATPIPDYFIEGSAVDLGKNFRFRVKLIETNDQTMGSGDKMLDKVPGPQPQNPDDDQDVFLVDNIAVMTPSPSTDLEAQVVKIVWPYEEVPASQGSDMSIIARIANMGTQDAKNFEVKVKAYVSGQTSDGMEIYCKTQIVPILAKGQAAEYTFTAFNPRSYSFLNVGPNGFVLQVSVKYANDIYKPNDTTSSDFILKFGDSYTYATSGAINQVDADKFSLGLSGKGLNLWATTYSGSNAPTTPNPQLISTARAGTLFWQTGRFPWLGFVAGGTIDQGRGDDYPGDGGGYLAGQIAIKFEVVARDSIRGLKAKFARANQAFDDISINIYKDQNGVPGGNTLATLYARRLLNKRANGSEGTEPLFNADVLYEFPQPIALDKGTYWASIDQRGETGLELAATDEAMGMKTTFIQAERSGSLAATGYQFLIEKRLRVPTNDSKYGRVYVNNNIFAYRNVIDGTYPWTKFMPTQGPIGYAHLDHYGKLYAALNNYNTFTRGTWQPLIKPYFGLKTIVRDTAKHPCPDDKGSGWLSVEVTSFDAIIRNGGIELAWETVSEVNNMAFIVERAEANEEVWTKVDEIPAAGNSIAVNVYKCADKDVENGKTYKYRLYSIGFDGTISCENDNIVTVEYSINNTVELLQNTPNPFVSETHIGFVIPEARNVTLDVIDIYGQVIKTLVNNEMLKGTQNYNWNGTDNTGAKVTNGVYIYRLTAGNEVITKKMTLIRGN